MNRIFLITLLGGCVTERNFPDRLNSITCKRSLECDKAAFEASYDNLGECLDENISTFDNLAACLVEAGCEFNEEEARLCIDDIARDDCDAVMSGESLTNCADAYTCDALEILEAGICFVF